MVSNHTKALVLFAIIYACVFLLSSAIYAGRPALLKSNPSVAKTVIATPTASRSVSNIWLLGAELVAVTLLSLSEMRYKLISRIYRFLHERFRQLNRKYTLALQAAAFIIFWYMIIIELGLVWFLFLFVNFIGILVVYHILLSKLKDEELVPIFVTFMSFFVLWPFSFLFIGKNTILLIFMEFAYMPVAFLISALIMRHPTKNRINFVAFMFSVLIPPVLATLFLPIYAVLLLAIFSVYDFIAVFWTKHMGFMAKYLISMNVPEAFLIGDFKKMKAKLKNINATRRKDYDMANKPLIFGVGDAVLPGMVIASFAMSGSWTFALAAVFGGVIGVMANLGVLRLRRHILPALPLIFIFMVLSIAIVHVL